MSQAPEDAEVRVTTLELFFDLVFVFTITQLTSVLVAEPTARGVLQAVLVLGVIWWMYAGYAWLTNALRPARALHRALLLGGMAGFLVIALAVPRAFAGNGTAFALGYLVVVSIHSGLFAAATRAIIPIARINVTAALILVAGGLAGGNVQYALWALVFVVLWSTPYFQRPTGFNIAAGHFVERHGLVVLVAIGESVVAIGIGLAAFRLDLELAGVAVLGLALSACLWWIYFGGDEERAEAALAAVATERRPIVAVTAFGHWHLLILLGIVAVAAAVKQGSHHPFEALELGPALELAGGVFVFLLGDVLFRRMLDIGAGRWRLGAAVLALATIPLGLAVAAAAQIAALVALLAGALVAEPAPAS
ncbi:MAG TPA: low temperature requirement protein A [Solirubrobacteraceae bacterium]|jgi:low temperature requirement protein LtrA